MNFHGILALSFRTALVLVAGSLLAYCAMKYIQNDNATSTEYKKFQKTEKDLYPSIALCFSGLAIYDADKMKHSYGIDNVYEYPLFLRGEIWNDTMVKVDYDDVTDHLKEFFN